MRQAEVVAFCAQMHAETATFRAELYAALLTQTRWMVTALVVLGGLFTTVSVLLR